MVNIASKSNAVRFFWQGFSFSGSQRSLHGLVEVLAFALVHFLASSGRSAASVEKKLGHVPNVM
jgi:hypothetical protein